MCGCVWGGGGATEQLKAPGAQVLVIGYRQVRDSRKGFGVGVRGGGGEGPRQILQILEMLVRTADGRGGWHREI